MDFFNKKIYEKKLYEYYIENFGESEKDIWLEKPAVNVSVFWRDNKVITLKCDVRTKEITEYQEEILFAEPPKEEKYKPGEYSEE